MTKRPPIQEMIEAALGKRPLTFLVKDVDLLNVFTGELQPSAIGIYGNTIVNVGRAAEEMKAEHTIHGTGRIAIPGLIDTHLHIESSMLTPANFAAAVLPHGTTTVCADPHEIANVFGKSGVEMMIENSKDLPLKVYYYAPSCVPESNAVTAGAEILPEDIRDMLSWDGIVGVGEVMDFVGVISGNRKMVDILETGRRSGAVLDGHCVFLSGNELNAYIAAGPEADHENFTPSSVVEKLRLGMYVKLRGPEVLDIRGVVDALKALPAPWRIIFVTDDVMPDNLLRGHLDFVCRTFIENGMDPIEAVRSATLRPAEHMRLFDIGAIAPGKTADIVLLGSLEKFDIDTVIANGAMIAKEGKLLVQIPNRPFSQAARNSVEVPKLSRQDFDIEAPISDGKVLVNVVDFTIPKNGASETSFLQVVLTKLGKTVLSVEKGHFCLGETALAVVCERHGRGGQRGIGFVRGLIREGAIASTVAHDAHNLVVVGTDPLDMQIAARFVVERGGGIAASKQGEILASIELPLAGLMSDEEAQQVGERMIKLRYAFREMGVLDHPYMPLVCLLTLSVIPHARITDKGTFDVDSQAFVPWLVNERNN